VHCRKINVEVKSYFKNLSRKETTACVPVDYFLVNPEGKKLLILLHGYKQSAEMIYNKVKSALPTDVSILVANGLYPLPERKDDHYEIGFAWHLYDDLKDEYLFDQKPAVSMMKSLIANLGFGKTPKILVGYSQGGYFAPFLAQELENVDRVVGVSCHFLVDEIKPPTYKIDALHGENDEVVKTKDATKAHEQLIKNGAKGMLQIVPGEGHKLTPNLVSYLEKMLN
jgi:predicted esterase